MLTWQQFIVTKVEPAQHAIVVHQASQLQEL